MSDILEELIGRQFEIARGEAEALPLPRFDTYTICNLRGGIGKTSLAFNLAYLADEILAVVQSFLVLRQQLFAECAVDRV